MVYDTVLCVHSRDTAIAELSIKAVDHFLKPRKIFLVSTQLVFEEIKEAIANRISLHFLDEDNLVEGLRLQTVSDILQAKMGVQVYPNWYYQQFLKMAVAQHPAVADHYLIWDSDTIPLSEISFFDEDDTILFNPQTENHTPYFEWIKDVLGIEKQVDYSFVDHNLMIKKAYMNELIQVLEDKAPADKSWYWLILNSIKNKHVKNSGFSEFETYGNYVMRYYPDRYKPRFLKTDRRGTNQYGLNPNRYDFFLLMSSDIDICTFEKWDSRSVIRVAIRKLRSRIHYWRSMNREIKRQQLKDAKAIAG